MDRNIIWATVLLAGLAVAGCQSGTTEPNKAPNIITEPPKGNPGGKVPGEHCFLLKEENLSIEGHLTYAPTTRAEGYLRGTRIDASDGYQSNFNTSFTGQLRNDTLILDVTSDASGSRESTQEKWIWRDSTLIEGGKVLRQVRCQ